MLCNLRNKQRAIMMNESNPSSTFQKAGGQVLLGKRTNCLLVKDDVGKSKPTTRKLPGDGFAFGKGNV